MLKNRIHGGLPLALAQVLALGVFVAASQARTPEENAQNIFSETGLHAGVIVHIGCGDGRLTGALGQSKNSVVHGLDLNPANVTTARAHIRTLGLYGRVSIDRLHGERLPYTDNLVNLVVAKQLGKITMDEVKRVLAPRGVAYVKQDDQWTATVKPWPKEIDEWTHYLHGSDGNPVAQDTVVGPPEHYQWISEPLWLRSHESDSSVKTLVTARGRLFYIADEAPTSLLGDHALPDKWFLTARDAFNGLLLWKVPIADWGWRAWKPSWFTPRPGDIPLNIQKRLVAIGDHVYATLGYGAPVSQLDAKTGKILRTYDQTARTAEILVHDGLLILTVLQENRARVAAIDSRSGQRRWLSPNDYGGTTTDYYRFRAMHGSVTPAKVDPTLNTATDGTVIALLDGEDVVCLDCETGKEIWRAPFPLVQADYRAGGIDAQRTLWTGTLIVQDGVVIHASPNQMAGFSAETGEVVWTQPKKYLQHLWYEWKDVFVIDGLVWTWAAELDRGQLAGGKQRSTWPTSVNGYDLHTGQLTKKVPLGNIFKTHHHHRCYRNKATTRYILASRRGTEFVDLRQGKHTLHNWVRGTCHLGMMPANGLQYAPPHPCVCYIDEKLNGFNALAPSRKTVNNRRRTDSAHQRTKDSLERSKDEGRRTKDEEIHADQHAGTLSTVERLEKGPAYGHVASRTSSFVRRPSSPVPGPDESWPTFRHDTMRSGGVKTRLSSTPRLLWRERVGAKVSPPVIADGRLFAALVDQHHVVALRVDDGQPVWEFAAGARVDSPPTYHRGTVLFGSADGWVYCLRATDGVLVWRFFAAPQDRRIGAFGQLESAWPVHGSVLVLDGTAYVAAGRSSQLDGGIHLYGMDAVSGQLRCQTKLAGPHYDVDNISENYQLPMGSLPDILQGGAGLIHMRNVTFDRELRQQDGRRPAATTRVSAKGGLLDDSYFKRSPWSFGSDKSYARLIVHDDQNVYLVRMFDTLRGLDPKVYFTPGKQGYLLFAADKRTGQQTWSRRISVRINTMVATDGLLLVAGPPDVVDPQDPLAAFEGRKGSVLTAVNSSTGNVVWEHKLSAATAFQGLAAASGRLLVTMQDGSIACFD